MNKPNLDLQALAARLHKLEKRDRIWRLVVVSDWRLRSQKQTIRSGFYETGPVTA